MVDGVVHHFGAVGLRDGLVILGDEETRSYWDHISGVCFEGPLKGVSLPVWPIRITTLEAQLNSSSDQPHGRAQDAAPDIRYLPSDHHSIRAEVTKRLGGGGVITRKGFIPPFFNKTMRGPVDDRQDRLSQGLGVIDGKYAKYYPMRSLTKGTPIEDTWQGRTLVVLRGEIDGVPRAVWADDPDGPPPMQLLSRWYGFSFTYPGCELYVG